MADDEISPFGYFLRLLKGFIDNGRQGLNVVRQSLGEASRMSPREAFQNAQVFVNTSIEAARGGTAEIARTSRRMVHDAVQDPRGTFSSARTAVSNFGETARRRLEAARRASGTAGEAIGFFVEDARNLASDVAEIYHRVTSAPRDVVEERINATTHPPINEGDEEQPPPPDEGTS